MAVATVLPTEFLKGVNKDAISLIKGHVVAVDSSGIGVLRATSANNTRNAIGLVVAGAAPTFVAKVQFSGRFELSDWTPITGTVSLSAMAIYYLDLVSGKMATVPPTGTGQIVQKVGRALSPQVLEIKIEPSIILA